MLSFIFLFFKITFFAFLFNDYLKEKYPEKYNEFLINISFKLIFLYSKSQIIVNRNSRYIANSISQIMIRNPKISNLFEICINYHNRFINKMDNKHNIEFISNGKVSFSISNEKITNEKLKTNIVFVDSYDFIVFSDFSQDNLCINKKIQKSIENKNFDYELSNISFILSEIIIGDKTIKVDFKTTQYNYYIVNNIFNDKFILYFLNKYYLFEIKDIPNETIQYFKLRIIDNNVDTYEYNKDSNIKIQKDGYIKNV